MSVDCPECGTKNVDTLPSFSGLSKTLLNAQGKPEFCQTCIKRRLGRLDALFKDTMPHEPIECIHCNTFVEPLPELNIHTCRDRDTGLDVAFAVGVGRVYGNPSHFVVHYTRLLPFKPEPIQHDNSQDPDVVDPG
jgi:hypothetical protein